MPDHGQGGWKDICGGVGREKGDVEDGCGVDDGVDSREVVGRALSVAMDGAADVLGVGNGFGHNGIRSVKEWIRRLVGEECVESDGILENTA